jgi:hypothetical protein
MSAIKVFEEILAKAKVADTLSAKMGSMRQLHESDLGTVDRLVSERHAVEAMITDFFRHDDRRNPHREPFDFNYKQHYIEILERIFAAAEVGWPEAERERERQTKRNAKAAEREKVGVGTDEHAD